MAKNNDKELKLKNGVHIEFESPMEQSEYEKNYRAPFWVVSSRFKDPTNKNLSENLWEEHAVIEDSDGRVLPEEISVYDLVVIK